MPTTKAYRGSCHCGDVQYQVKLTFPPDDSDARPPYKCNCSSCHKMGFFHCRPRNPGNDFILTSPSTIEELGDYRTFSKKLGWHSCKRCGVHVFLVGAQWEQVDLDVEKWAGNEGAEGNATKVWMLKQDGVLTAIVDGVEISKPRHFVSVNAVTLDVGDGGVDLNEWYEKGWVQYVDGKERYGKDTLRFGKPHPGGTY